MLELTKAERQVMQVLWTLKSAFVKDIVEKFGEPKPAYNTVSTIIRILEKKEFVGHKSYGKTYEYYPLISKEEYTKTFLNSFIKNYFGNSFKKMVAFFSKEEDLEIHELEDLKNMMDDIIKTKNESN